jgi:hypothetical protein
MADLRNWLLRAIGSVGSIGMLGCGSSDDSGIAANMIDAGAGEASNVGSIDGATSSPDSGSSPSPDGNAGAPTDGQSARDVGLARGS